MSVSTTAAPARDNPPADERRERTAALFDRRSGADDAERAELEDEIIRINLQMATDATRRFRDRGVPSDDVQQIAHLGLVKAVRRFDPDLGHDFLSFAVPTIRGEVRRYFRDHGWTVRPSRAVQEAQSRINASEQELSQRFGRAPRPTEIAEHLGLDLELVVEAIGATGCFSPVSLDTPLRDEGVSSTLGARLAVTEEDYDLAEMRAMLEPALDRLAERDRTIVELRFFEGMTQAEVGARIGVTQMQVSRLLARILRHLREDLEEESAA